MVRILLDAGADIDMQDMDGDTPLIVAASEGNIQIVDLLLSRGASLEEEDDVSFQLLSIFY